MGAKRLCNPISSALWQLEKSLSTQEVDQESIRENAVPFPRDRVLYSTVSLGRLFAQLQKEVAQILYSRETSPEFGKDTQTATRLRDLRLGSSDKSATGGDVDARGLVSYVDIGIEGLGQAKLGRSLPVSRQNFLGGAEWTVNDQEPGRWSLLAITDGSDLRPFRS